MKPQRYRDDRPAEYFSRFHERARSNRQGGLVYFLARLVMTPPTLLLYRPRVIGRENVPKKGPAILAPNHLSQMDHFFCGVYLWRHIRFMGKSQLFGPPILTWILHHGGAFPVRRGTMDEEAFKTSAAILEHGNLLLIYAEGGRSRSGQLGQPRPGVGRIALESGVPVIPVAIHGSAEVRNIHRLRFPKVTIQFGEPITFPREPAAGRERWAEVAEEIFARVREMYEALDERRGRPAPKSDG